MWVSGLKLDKFENYKDIYAEFGYEGVEIWTSSSDKASGERMGDGERPGEEMARVGEL